MDTERIIRDQKEQFLKHGQVSPVLWVELVNGTIARYPFKNFPFRQTEEKQRVFFYFGQVVAQQHPGDALRQICFLMEVWLSTNTRKPSQDPQRGEGLIVSILDVDGRSLSQLGKLFEIIRAGPTVDLVEQSELSVQGNILPFFVVGFTKKQKSIENV